LNQPLLWDGSLPLFYEMLMHMRISFRVTMKNCDGDVVSVLTERSSIQKGKIIQDTIQTLT
jgi:aspartate carbamoyltransferase catalytic subunit